MKNKSIFINFYLAILFTILFVLPNFGLTTQDEKASGNKPVLSIETKAFLGIWESISERKNGKFQIVLEIREDKDKTLYCLVSFPSQGMPGIQVEGFSITGNKLNLTIPMIKFPIKGTLRDNKFQIDAAMGPGNEKIPLLFNKVDKISAVMRSQTPIPPYPYEEKEVEFMNKTDGTKLSGTITFPKIGTKFPSVILLTGSGAQDRNEEGFGGHRFFQVLADDLTKRGIAVLRYDDRGTAKSTGDFSRATIFDFANDAEAGLDLLKTLPFIDREKIGLLGHSEGGDVALILAGRRSDVAFIVSMAGVFMKGIDVLKFQNKGALDRIAVFGLKGNEKIPALLDEALDIILKEKDITTIRNKIGLLFNNSSFPDEIKKSFIELYSSAGMIFEVRTDPADYLAKVRCPILSLGGTKDVAVPVKENQEALKRIMNKLGRTNCEMVEFPNMNHFFQTTNNGLFFYVPQINETMSPLAMKTIGEWILKTTK